jgi:hypothetical protein
MAERRWVSVHIFHHANLDGLLVQAARPLIHELIAAELAQEYFFIRYWEGGPHLRLRILPTTSASHQEIEQFVGSYLSRYLAEHPAPTKLRQEEYSRGAVRLARWQGVSSYDTMLHANNSVMFVPYRPEHGLFGQGRSLEAIEHHFFESSDITLDTIADGANTEQRAALSLAFHLITLFVCEPDFLRAAGSSAAAAMWLRQMTEDRAVPDDLDHRYRQQRDRLLRHAALLRRVTGQAVNAPEAATSAYTRWIHSISRLREILLELAKSGMFAPCAADTPLAAETTAMPQEKHPIANVLLRCAHLINNRLGVPSQRELCLRYLAIRAFAENAEEVI